MANLETLQPNVFSKDNQPENRGRKKGVPNRATVYRRILEMKTKIKDANGKEITLPMYEAIALGQAKSALDGNTQAWKEIQDSIYGKIVDKNETALSVNKIEVVFTDDGK